MKLGKKQIELLHKLRSGWRIVVKHRTPTYITHPLLQSIELVKYDTVSRLYHKALIDTDYNLTELGKTIEL
jgi:hypothetical protein